jgi:hypothetical protein
MHDAQHHKRHRRKDAEGRIAGQQTDQEGRNCHRRDRERERCAPAKLISDVGDDHAAKGAHQITDGEYAEGGEQLRDRLVSG